MAWFRRDKAPPGTAVGFGYKCGWLAIRAPASEPVIAVLRLEDVRPSRWRAGIEHAYQRGVFVSPPVDGWVLVVGHALGATEDEARLVALSRDLDTVVQAYATHRVVEYHAWAWAERGTLRRGYAYDGNDGEVIWDVRSSDDELPEVPAFERPDEGLVMEVAGAWSVDPTTLDGRVLGEGWTAR